MKNKLSSLLGKVFVILFIIGLFYIITFFGGAIMKVFGLTYDSFTSVVIFFILTSLFGFPLELFAKALPIVLLNMNRLQLIGARTLFLFLDTLTTSTIMLIVDHYMDSVSASNSSIVVISFVMAATSLEDIKYKDIE